jgi:16S rRNA processing protein RimM
MQMEVITDFPERIRRGVTVYVGETHLPVVLHSSRSGGSVMLVAFEGYENPEAMAGFRNAYVYVRAEDRPPLPQGEYYHHQLLGLRVVTDQGQVLGNLSAIIDNPANDIYIVRPEHGPEILLPAIEQVILEIDLPGGEMLVHLLPGLIPEKGGS